MKIEIDIPDLEEIYLSRYTDNEINGKDIKEAIADVAIEKFIDKLYDNYMNDRAYKAIKDEVNDIVKNHSKEIVDTVINKVAVIILQKKSIMNEMPKKSEINNINKEWEDYFMELIDRAIAKKFRQS